MFDFSAEITLLLLFFSTTAVRCVHYSIGRERPWWWSDVRWVDDEERPTMQKEKIGVGVHTPQKLARFTMSFFFLTQQRTFCGRYPPRASKITADVSYPPTISAPLKLIRIIVRPRIDCEGIHV